MPLQREQLPSDLAVVEGELAPGEWEPIAYVGPERGGGHLLCDPEDYSEIRVRFFGPPTQPREALERAVVGALRSAIKDHGPITAEHIGSAAKRVVGNLENVGRMP